MLKCRNDVIVTSQVLLRFEPGVKKQQFPLIQFLISNDSSEDASQFVQGFIFLAGKTKRFSEQLAAFFLNDRQVDAPLVVIKWLKKTMIKPIIEVSSETAEKSSSYALIDLT